MRISQFNDLPLIIPKKFDNLKDGYNIVDITSQSSYKETSNYW